MSRIHVLAEGQPSEDFRENAKSPNSVCCARTETTEIIPALTSDLCNVFADAGCPLAFSVQERLRFETFLAQLSATFVNVAASEIDSEITSALRQIVEFLGIDRSGFGELLAEKNALVITHSYEMPGVPPSPRVVVDERMPWYARTVFRGETIQLPRLPDCLPHEAAAEREYCASVGLKSQLTIPLKVNGSVVGGIGFASFRSYRDWPDDLIQRLRLVGEIFTNAIARKRADEALSAANEQSRILREELAHAARLELINHVTVSIAHEVNQPLCAIASNAQTAIELLKIGDIEEATNALTDMWNDARRGSEVIVRIRSMAKKQQSGRSLSNLATIIEELSPILAREAAARSANLSFDVHPTNLAAVCDRVQVQQVILNLLLNALEAVSDTGTEAPAVIIRGERSDASWLDISVEDNGVGLSDADCERVFAPLFTTKANGLGMGLSISRSIVESHGGKLWASPAAAKGTIFHIRLPAFVETIDGK